MIPCPIIDTVQHDSNPPLPLSPTSATGCVHLTNYRGDLVDARNHLGRPPAVIVRAGDSPNYPMPLFVRDL